MLKCYKILTLFGFLMMSVASACAQDSGHTIEITVHADTVKGMRFPCKKYDTVTVARNWHNLKRGMLQDNAIELIGCPDRAYYYASDSSTYWWYVRRLVVFKGVTLVFSAAPYAAAVVDDNFGKVRINMVEASVVSLLGAPERIEFDPINALYYWWYGKRAVVITAMDKKVWYSMVTSRVSGG